MDLNLYHKGCGGRVTVKVGTEVFPYEHDNGKTEMIQDTWLECEKCKNVFQQNVDLIDAEGNPAAETN